MRTAVPAEKARLLTRDPRAHERKKYGQKGLASGFQFLQNDKVPREASLLFVFRGAISLWTRGGWRNNGALNYLRR